jgi:predicted dehydrogenase
LQRVKNEFGFEVATEEFEKLLEIPDLDGVFVSSPRISL